MTHSHEQQTDAAFTPAERCTSGTSARLPFRWTRRIDQHLWSSDREHASPQTAAPSNSIVRLRRFREKQRPPGSHGDTPRERGQSMTCRTSNDVLKPQLLFTGAKIMRHSRSAQLGTANTLVWRTLGFFQDRNHTVRSLSAIAIECPPTHIDHMVRQRLSERQPPTDGLSMQLTGRFRAPDPVRTLRRAPFLGDTSHSTSEC